MFRTMEHRAITNLWLVTGVIAPIYTISYIYNLDIYNLVYILASTYTFVFSIPYRYYNKENMKDIDRIKMFLLQAVLLGR